MSGFKDQGRGGGRGGRGDTGGRQPPSGGGGRDFSGGRGRGDGGGRGGGGGGGGYAGGGGRGGDGGRGGRGGGGNPHIGETSFLSRGSHRGMTDAAIMAVISPPASERVRTALAANPRMPGLHRDRAGVAIGAQFPTTSEDMVVTTNHFAVNPDSCPSTITHYHVHLYRVGQDGNNRSEDVASLEDVRKTVQAMKSLRAKHREWTAPPVGFAYDTKSALFTTRALGLREINTDGQPFHSEIVGLPNSDGTESAVLRYRVTLIEVARNVQGLDKIRAQEIAVLMYGRWDVVFDRPNWNVVNSCIYAGSDALSATVKPFMGATQLLAKQGWYASLKPCAVGPMLTVDLACCAFLASGSMVELMSKAAGYGNVNDFLRCFAPGGQSTLQRGQVENIERSIAKTKVKVTHLGFWKVVRHLGPSSSSKESEFEHEGKKYTVADYYALKAKTDNRYKPLKYPHLPTVNMGSAARKELYPIELVDVPSGQPRNRMLTEIPQLGGEMIRHAAVKPAERMRHIVESSQSVVKMLRTDETARAFGLGNVSLVPAKVPATVLPPPKLQYGGANVMEPGTKGSWSADYPRKVPFYRAPPNPTAGVYRYGKLLISGGRKPLDGWEETLAGFCATLESDSTAVGAKLASSGPHLVCRSEPALIEANLKQLQRAGAQIVLVVMFADNAYGTVKLVSDTLGLPTQCIKWEKLEKSPRGIHFNVVLKMNFKLGGTSHVHKSRLAGGPGATAPAAPGVFQSPPASLSWIFDRPCMLVGIDVSHPEPGSMRESMAAVVGSVDGSATKYVAHISSQAGRQEMVGALTDAMGCLLTSFRARNKGAMPETLIVFRDGVSEGQYDQVLTQELPQIQHAVELQGFALDRVRVVVVVCTKGHRTRIVCQEGPGGEYINPCPGLVVDSVVTSETLNEFYLNSHAAIQGTAKPCRYTVLYDEVGFKMSELQLLTYWTTYLYARCNKSVSYATPAYYAHWASKRGKELLAAGASKENLRDICATCSRVNTGGRDNNMFFL